MGNRYTGAPVDPSVGDPLEGLLRAICPNRCYAESVRRWDRYFIIRALTDTSNGCTEMAQHGRLGVAHLALDGQLRLHKHVTTDASCDGDHDGRDDEDRREQDDGEHLQEHVNDHFDKDFGRSRDPVIHYDVMSSR